MFTKTTAQLPCFLPAQRVPGRLLGTPSSGYLVSGDPCAWWGHPTGFLVGQLTNSKEKAPRAVPVLWPDEWERTLPAFLKELTARDSTPRPRSQPQSFPSAYLPASILTLPAPLTCALLPLHWLCPLPRGTSNPRLPPGSLPHPLISNSHRPLSTWRTSNPPNLPSLLECLT